MYKIPKVLKNDGKYECSDEEPNSKHFSDPSLTL